LNCSCGGANGGDESTAVVEFVLVVVSETELSELVEDCR